MVVVVVMLKTNQGSGLWRRLGGGALVVSARLYGLALSRRVIALLSCEAEG